MLGVTCGSPAAPLYLSSHSGTQAKRRAGPIWARHCHRRGREKWLKHAMVLKAPVWTQCKALLLTLHWANSHIAQSDVSVSYDHMWGCIILQVGHQIIEKYNITH